MNQTATWDKIWRYDHFSQFHTYHFTIYHLLKIPYRMMRKWLRYHCYQRKLYHVQIRIGQRIVDTKGFYDTGNSLFEPVRHEPVSIITKSLADRLMEDDEKIQYCMIPYRSIGTAFGLMRGFIVDEITVYEGGYPFSKKNPVLAIANESFGEERYEIILNPDLI